MVSLHITDSSFVVSQGVTISGPCSLDVSSVVNGSETITSGVVLVHAGTVERLAELHPQTQAILPLGATICFLLGLIWARQSSV